MKRSYRIFTVKNTFTVPNCETLEEALEKIGLERSKVQVAIGIPSDDKLLKK